MTDRGNHHPYVTEPSCSLQATVEDGVLTITYVSTGDRPRNVQVYSYVNAPRDDKPGHVGDSHRHSLEANETLADGESLTLQLEDGATYEVHYAGDWYLLVDLLTYTEASCGTTTTTTTAPTTTTTEGTTTTTEATTTTTSGSTTSTTAESTTSTSAASSTSSSAPSSSTSSLPTPSAPGVRTTTEVSVPPPPGRELAYTGGHTADLAIGGLLLVATGAALLRRFKGGWAR